MVLGEVNLELRRQGEAAKLVLRAKPFSHETAITLSELHRLVSELAQAVTEWERARTGNYYAVLGLARHATADEIQQAYRAQAKRAHPDTSTQDTTAAMQALNEAYAVLGDPQQRQDYDRTL